RLGERLAAQLVASWSHSFRRAPACGRGENPLVGQSLNQRCHHVRQIGAGGCPGCEGACREGCCEHLLSAWRRVDAPAIFDQALDARAPIMNGAVVSKLVGILTVRRVRRLRQREALHRAARKEATSARSSRTAATNSAMSGNGSSDCGLIEPSSLTASA